MRSEESFWKGLTAKLLNGLMLVAVVLIVSGCSIEKKLNRNFKGKSFSEVMSVMGAPTNVETQVGGGTIRSYATKKMLKGAPINTGQFQYDRFETPKVLQTTVTQFFVTPEGKVREVRYSSEFSR